MNLVFGGNVVFSAFGAYCEDFINDLFSQKILIKNIRNENNIFYAETSAKYYPRIARLSRKYGVRTSVVRRKGLYFRIAPLKKRPGLTAGILASAVMVLVLRLFVWNIEIHGNSKLTDEQILAMLEPYGFTAGVYANDTDALTAERKILMSTDEINWINIEVNGSRADVYLNENTDINETNDIKTPCNIVASRTGVITDTDVTAGQLLYEKGSGVSEGSVIVSGTVSSGDTLILVHSSAKIIADFTDNVEFEADYSTVEKVPSSDSFTHRQLMLLGIVIPLDGNNKDTADTVCAESVQEMEMFGFPLPIKLKTERYNRYTNVCVTRKTEDLERILEGRLELYICNFCKDYEVLGIEKEYEETDSGLKIKARIDLRGDIGIEKTIYQH